MFSAAWTAPATRCPLFAVIRDTEAMYHFPVNAEGGDEEGSAGETVAGAGGVSATLEVVEDDALAVALMDLHAQLPATQPANEGTQNFAAAAAAVCSAVYTTPRRSPHWRLGLPEFAEALLVAYDVPTAAQGALTATLPSDPPTFILLVLKECGACSN